MKHATSIQVFFSLLLALLPQLGTDALAQAALKLGDRVEVDIIMAGAPERALWRLGIISKIEKGEYFIRLDNGEERSLPIRPDKHWVRASQVPVPASAPAPTIAPKPTVTTPTPPAAPPPKPAPVPTGDTKAESDPALKPPGLGAPPNGVYNCQKIGQTYMGLGPLEIRGKTYRGIGKDGGFHPFTVDAAGQITWSAGIAGLPKGWTIRSSYFAGKDAQGRPLIKIYYRSASGFNDLIDCVRE